MIASLVRFTFVAALAVACLLAGDIRQADAQLLRQTIEELSVEPPDPAVEQWVQRSQRGPAELGRAISALTRMGEFEKVNEIAARLGSLGYKAPQKVLVAEQIDPAERLRIVSHPDVGPEAITAIDDVFKLRQESLASPQRLAKAIDALTSSNVDQSLPAIRVLFEGGEASTAALAHAIVTERDSDKRDSLLRAMIRIDEASGVKALQRISLYGTDLTRAGALSALVRLAGRNLAGDEAVLAELMTALYRQDDASDDGAGVSASARIASDTLASTGVAIPTRTSVIEELSSQLEAADQLADRSLRDFGRVTAWVINEQRTGVSPQRIPQWVLEFRNAADAAARLVAVGDNDAASVVRQLNAILAYNVANNPDWGSSDQVAAFRSNELLPAVGVTQSSEIDFLLSAIDLAKETQNEPALIGWLRMIQPVEDISPAPWFVATGRHVSSLVDAVDHPNPIVRYEAAAAIARLRPTDAYAGSARVRQRWRQMSLLTDRPTAIVLENRPEVIAELETLINQAGLEPRFATSARQAEVLASLGEDLRLIISKREPFDASAVELIDRIRRISAARDTPLVIYRDPPQRVAEETPDEEEDLSGLNEAELQKLADEAAVTPDRFGVIGGIENIKGIVHRELLYGDLDVDHTTRIPLNLEWVGEERWGDESLRAGLIRDIERPRSVAGLYELLLASRRHLHLPPLSPVDRARFRDIAAEALADSDR